MKKLALMGALAALLGACSDQENMPYLLFSGPCQVSVEVAKPHGAKILVDGIEVGEGKAEMDIPCGEKQILVESHGYRPYFEYLKVSEGKPLKVKVELKELEHQTNYALSAQLVEDVKSGKLKVNAVASAAPGAPAAAAAPAADAPMDRTGWDKMESWL